MRRMPARGVGEPGELRSVGGQRELFEAVADAGSELADQMLDALAHKRLATGQAELPHPPPDKDVR